jgi:WD40 repeat protein
LRSLETGAFICQAIDLAWSPEGNQLIGVMMHSVVAEEQCWPPTIWDVQTGDVSFTFPEYMSGVTDVDWPAEPNVILMGDAEGVVRAWDLENGEESLRLSAHNGAVSDVAWSPDGRSFASAGEDGFVRKWDGVTGEELLAISHGMSSVYEVSWSPSGRSLTVAGADGMVQIWDVTSGELMVNLVGHDGDVTGVTWSPDGKRVSTVSVDGTARIWSSITGNELSRLPGRQGMGIFGKTAFSWSPTTDLLATGSEMNLVIWDVSQNTLQLSGHIDVVRDAQWSPNGTTIATASHDGTVRIWDVNSGTELLSLKHDGISIWMDWSPNGTQLVTTDSSGPGKVWDSSTGALLMELPAPPGTWASDAAWSPDGTRIVVSYYTPEGPGYAIIFDARTGEELAVADRVDDTCYISTPSWSPSGDRFVVGCWFSQAEDSPARVCDGVTGEELKLLDSDVGHTWSTEWSPDGNHIVTGSSEGVARVWDVNTQEVLAAFTRHGAGIMGVAWSPDGARIASGDTGGEVKVWDATSGEEVLSFSVPASTYHVAWSPGGKYLIVPGMYQVPVVKRVWQSTDALIAHAYECCVTRQLTPEERAQFGLKE